MLKNSKTRVNFSGRGYTLGLYPKEEERFDLMIIKYGEKSEIVLRYWVKLLPTPLEILISSLILSAIRICEDI